MSSIYHLGCSEKGCNCQVEVPHEMFIAVNMMNTGYSTANIDPVRLSQGFETIVPGMCKHLKRWFYRNANRYLGNEEAA